jgi:hypothetical protein
MVGRDAQSVPSLSSAGERANPPLTRGQKRRQLVRDRKAEAQKAEPQRGKAKPSPADQSPPTTNS